MATKIVVDYDHDPANLAPIYLAVTTLNRPSDDAWKPALRDVVDGHKVVWARFSEHVGQNVMVWVRDHTGERRVRNHKI